MYRNRRGINRVALDPYSEEARFPTLFADRMREQQAAQNAFLAAQGAPSGTIAARENPMRWGSIFQRENPGAFNLFREGQAAQYQRGLDRMPLNEGRRQTDRNGDSAIDRYARGMGYNPNGTYIPDGAGTYANPYGTQSPGIARAPTFGEAGGVTSGVVGTAPLLPNPPKPPKPFDPNYAPSLKQRTVGGVPTYGDRYGD